jgi:iron-sulfur cluster repair protein YtfE (RIC family)
MVHTGAVEFVPHDTARMSEFLHAAERLKEEHERLREQLAIVYSLALKLGGEVRPDERLQQLRRLRQLTTALVARLDAHMKWEEGEMFPLISSYNNRSIAPSITPSLWVIEKGYELSGHFIQPFLELADAIVSGEQAEEVRQASAHLVQACLILQEHLQLEEELIFPVADEMLTDIDYFFS